VSSLLLQMSLGFSSDNISTTFHSCLSFFQCIFIVQRGFCYGISPMNTMTFNLIPEGLWGWNESFYVKNINFRKTSAECSGLNMCVQPTFRWIEKILGIGGCIRDHIMNEEPSYLRLVSLYERKKCLVSPFHLVKAQQEGH
jgi:hypothetical protein